MSYKYSLLTPRTAGIALKRAECSDRIARMYRSREGDPRGAIGRILSAISGESGDRRVHTARTVRHLFGSRVDDHPAALACDPYLIDALYRWLLATCRTPDARATYSARMWRWVDHSGRRSLSAQVDAPAREVSDFLHHLESGGLAPRSVVSHRDVMRSWFRWLFDRDLVHRSPVTRDVVRSFRVDQAQVVKADGTRQSLTASEAGLVADWCMRTAAPEAGAAIMLQLTGGLRSAEVAALERRHLVERDGAWLLTIPGKGKKQRTITLEPAAVAALQRYEAAYRRTGDRGKLLVGRGPVSTRSVQRWAKEAAAAIGREDIISSHDLRRTAATLLVRHGAAIDQVQRHLGHSSIETTRRCYVTDRPAMTATTGITAKGKTP